MAMLFITRWYLWYRHPTIFFCSFCAHISWMLRRLTSRSGRVSSWWSPYAHLKSVGEPQVVPPEKSPERSIGFIASFELRIYHYIHLYRLISLFFPIWLFVTWKSWGFYGLLNSPRNETMSAQEVWKVPAPLAPCRTWSWLVGHLAKGTHQSLRTWCCAMPSSY